jgi:hypothetical protein
MLRLSGLGGKAGRSREVLDAVMAARAGSFA